MHALESYEVYLTAAAVMAVTTTARHAIRIATAAKGDDATLRCLRHPLVEIAITLSTLVIGALVGLSGFLPGDSVTERVLLGVVAGFISKFGDSILKRLFPVLIGGEPLKDDGTSAIG